MEHIIDKATDEGDLVVDFFGGVATIPVASVLKNRNYFASELDERFYNIGVDRLKQAEKDYERLVKIKQEKLF
jgi:DNA modification methylase